MPKQSNNREWIVRVLFPAKNRTPRAIKAGECGMIVYEKNSYSRTRSFL
jgi:hypothetical protein